MPPRRATRRRGATPQKPRNQGQRNSTLIFDETLDSAMEEDQEIKCDANMAVQNGTDVSEVNDAAMPDEDNIKDDPNEEEVKEEKEEDYDQEPAVESEEKTEKTEEISSFDMPYKVKVSHLPANYNLTEFINYLKITLNIVIDKIITTGKNSPWLVVPFNTKEEQENFIRLLHNHVYKKKSLRAVAFYCFTSTKRPLEESENNNDNKKLKIEEIPFMTLEEEILSESLPLFSVPYEEQNRLTNLDVELLSNKLHAFMCVRNPALAGWAEAMCEQNNGVIFKIEPLKTSPLLEGYRNKCKFRIGKNSEGETTVGFCLNDNENKILGVQPGDKLIHLPDSMKYTAKKFEDFIRASGKEPYDKKQKTGYWDHIIIRIAPEGGLMLVVVMYPNQLTSEEISEIKEQIKDFFVNGDGKDCNVYSLYFQLMNDKHPMLPPDKLELLHGESHFFENICGLKFFVGPFSILNVNYSSSENIYKSIAELANPTPDTTILDLCSGTGGIAFTIASKCKNVIAIEAQEDNIKDALKTKEINNIQNVDFIKGKVENELAKVFESLGDVPVIPIIDPPRQGLVQKAISQLRARESIKKLIYVCSNSKMGAKNFLDLCASSEKKEGTFGNPLNVEFAGLPFLPVKAIPVDVAPYTVNNTIIILFERIDPSTFPPAKNPPPQPLKKPSGKEEKKRTRRGKRGRGGIITRGGRGGLGFRRGSGGLNFRRGGGGSRGGFNQNRFPQSLLRNVDPAMSLVAKYERRIAELEQQDRAFKAGLTMGLQALGTRGSSGGNAAGGNFDSNFDGPMGNLGSIGNLGSMGNVGNMSNLGILGNLGNLGNMGNNFGNFRNQFSSGNQSGWQRGGRDGGKSGGGGSSSGNSSGRGRNFGDAGRAWGGPNFRRRTENRAFTNFNQGGCNEGSFCHLGGGNSSNFGGGGGSNRGRSSGGFRNYKGSKHRR